MRSPLNQLRRLLADAERGLTTLNRIQFAAPWRDAPRRSR